MSNKVLETYLQRAELRHEGLHGPDPIAQTLIGITEAPLRATKLNNEGVYSSDLFLACSALHGLTRPQTIEEAIQFTAAEYGGYNLERNPRYPRRDPDWWVFSTSAQVTGSLVVYQAKEDEIQATVIQDGRLALRWYQENKKEAREGKPPITQMPGYLEQRMQRDNCTSFRVSSHRDRIAEIRFVLERDEAGNIVFKDVDETAQGRSEEIIRALLGNEYGLFTAMMGDVSQHYEFHTLEVANTDEEIYADDYNFQAREKQARNADKRVVKLLDESAAEELFSEPAKVALRTIFVDMAKYHFSANSRIASRYDDKKGIARMLINDCND